RGQGRVPLDPGAQATAAEPRLCRHRPSGGVGAAEPAEVPRRQCPARERPIPLTVFDDVLEPEPEAAVRRFAGPVAARRANAGRKVVEQPRCVEERLAPPEADVLGIVPGWN